MKREFKYDFKENMTKEEFDAVIKQHYDFLGVDKLETELNDTKGKLTPFVQKERNSHIKELAKDFKIDEAKFNDAISLSKIEADDDDKTIQSKLTETLKDREYLLVKQDDEFLKKQNLKINKEKSDEDIEKDIRKEQKFGNI